MKILSKILLMCSVFLFSCEADHLIASESNAELLKFKQKEASENEDGCETFFAKGSDELSTCFIEDGFNRWGWTIGSLTGGEYNFDLYAGAGQCDTEKGTLVGTLTVVYDATTGVAEVSYTMSSGFSLRETHFYIGNDPYPTKKNGKPTVAPGQFPEKHDGLEGAPSDSYTITGLTGDIYIIGHGVVCGDDDEDDGSEIPT